MCRGFLLINEFCFPVEISTSGVAKINVPDSKYAAMLRTDGHMTYRRIDRVKSNSISIKTDLCHAHPILVTVYTDTRNELRSPKIRMQAEEICKNNTVLAVHVIWTDISRQFTPRW